MLPEIYTKGLHAPVVRLFACDNGAAVLGYGSCQRRQREDRRRNGLHRLFPSFIDAPRTGLAHDDLACHRWILARGGLDLLKYCRERWHYIAHPC